MELVENGVYPGFPTLFWGLSGFFVNDLMGKALWSSWKTRSVFRVYPGFPTLFWGLSGFFVNDLMGKALWSSWKTRSVFQGAVGAFCASTAPSASTGPICMRQDRRVLGLQSTRE